MTPRPTRKQIWRKRITRAILCLLLGAVTTVGVAWGCATWSSARWSAFPDVEESNGFCILRADGFGYRARQPHGARFAEGEPLYWRNELPPGRSAAGWPAPALRSHVEPLRIESGRLASGWDLPVAEIIRRGVPTNRLPAVIRSHTDRRIPLLPRWGGLTADTLFYAAPWWLILITPGALKRWRRRRRGRGRCIHCGYDLTGLPAGTVSGGTVLRTVTGADGAQHEDTARRAVPPTCPECGT